MSEIKPEETVQPAEVAPVAEPAAEALPAIAGGEPPAAAGSDKPAEEPPAEDAVVTEDKKEEEPKAITQGTIYKTHAGLLSFLKIKRFFYFQEEPVSEADLRTYLYKDNSSKATAAYALQTGKGLWFYSKGESDKTPHGIINLADVTEVTGTGSNKFVLKISTGDPLHFEAPAVERDNWVYTLKAKIAEAKSAIEEVTKSEAYEAALEKLSNPVKPAVPPKDDIPQEPTAETPAEEAAKSDDAGVTSDTDGSPSDTKADVKRSASKKNKRISGFPVPAFFGKKPKTEEKPEEKKDEEAKHEDKAAEVPDAAPGAEPVVNEPAAEGKPAEEAAAEEKKEETRPEIPAKKVDRRSFFQRFGGKKESAAEEKKEGATEETPAVVETDSAEGAAVVETAAEPPAEEKKDDKKAPTSPKADILAFFHKRDKSPVPKAAPAEDKKEEDAATAEASKEDTAPATEEVPAEAAKETNHKEKRKSSFFTFGGKKAEDVKSDSEDAEPSTKPSTSPVPKGILGSLKRKVSKAGRAEKETKEVAAPAAVAEEEAAVPETAEAVPTEEAKAEESKEVTGEPAATIGDVVPAAVSVGEAKPVQAAA